jgi:hypothetical protein
MNFEIDPKHIIKVT